MHRKSFRDETKNVYGDVKREHKQNQVYVKQKKKKKNNNKKSACSYMLSVELEICW